MLTEVLKFVGSFAAGAALVAWLIKALATQVLNRDLDRFRSDLKIESQKYIAAHQDKVAMYRAVTDLVVDLLNDLLAVHRGDQDFRQMAGEFERRRMKLYGYLAMMAPQDVMDSHDALMDHLLAIVFNGEEYDWDRIRALVLDHLNDIRKDLGIDKSPIVYGGTRHQHPETGPASTLTPTP